MIYDPNQYELDLRMPEKKYEWENYTHNVYSFSWLNSTPVDSNNRVLERWITT